MARSIRRKKTELPLMVRLAANGADIHARYGPQIGWTELLQILQDRDCVRYPCEICFSDFLLLPGEFAHPVPKGPTREAGYTIYVHPVFANQLARVPYMVLCQLPLVNYGEQASAEDAETFGSHALGLSREEYYAALCELSSQIGGDELC